MQVALEASRRVETADPERYCSVTVDASTEKSTVGKQPRRCAYWQATSDSCSDCLTKSLFDAKEPRLGGSVRQLVLTVPTVQGSRSTDLQTVARSPRAEPGLELVRWHIAEKESLADCSVRCVSPLSAPVRGSFFPIVWPIVREPLGMAGTHSPNWSAPATEVPLAGERSDFAAELCRESDLQMRTRTGATQPETRRCSLEWRRQAVERVGLKAASALALELPTRIQQMIRTGSRRVDPRGRTESPRL